MGRKIRTLEDARRVLEPHYSIMLDCIKKSFELHLKIQEFVSEESQYYQLKHRTKANLISDFIEGNITEAFSETESVKTGMYNDVFGINVNNEFFVRFKKMDKSFKTGNVNTKQQRNIQSQRSIIGFPENPTFVFAGYIPDRAWLSISGFYIACWDGNSLEWYDEFGNHSFEQLTIKFESDNTDKIHTEIEKKITLKQTKVVKLKSNN